VFFFALSCWVAAGWRCCRRRSSRIVNPVRFCE
jgi:hypothetical protein